MQQGINYPVDIVLCVDATGSMASIIERVKTNAMKFYDDLASKMKEKDKHVDKLRIKVIAFRDYYVDGDKSMLRSVFFNLPEEQSNFNTFVSSIVADGGGDEPETGLEALSLAIKSDWTKAGDKRRHVIVIWTDASVHPLEKDMGKKPAGYPQGIPTNLDELTDLWYSQSYMSPSAKRLVLFAPDAYCWTDLANQWDYTIQFTSRAGAGLSEIDYLTILDFIAGSI